MQPQFDLLLQGGTVIDPANGLNGKFDVAVKDGRIAAVAPEIPASTANDVVNLKDALVLPGMIDTHGHIFHAVSGRFGLEPDMVGVQSGVTGVVDQGGASCMTFPGFRKFIAEPARSRIYSFISAYVVGGLEGHFYPDLYGPTCMDVAATVRVAQSNADIVKGIKLHAEIGGFARWGTDVIQIGAQIGRVANLPLYIHFGQLWSLPKTGGKVDPDTILPEVVSLLKEGDILAHPFSRHPGGFIDRDGKVHDAVWEALERGARIDVGHGSHFSFRVARDVLDAGIVPDTLGADMHGYNTLVPKPAGSPDEHPDEENHPFRGKAQFSLTYAMTGLLALGLSLEQIVPMVTTGPARMLGLQGELGTLSIGAVADISVLHDRRGKWLLQDNERNKVIAERLLEPMFCLRAGQRFETMAPILPSAQAA